MQILEDIQFEKSLPRENKAQILNKIAAFLRDWAGNPNRSEVSSLHSVKKVKGDTKLKEVWKFKVSGGDRILFTKGKFLEFAEEGHENDVVLLRFCNHDEQIVKARRLASARPKEEARDIETFIEESIDQEAVQIEYNPETAITRVFKHLSIEELVSIEGLQGIFYLNEEQRSCVNADYRPMVLFGSAGSGKTTIGVYKLIDLLKQNPEIKVGYFTYSSQLKQSAQKIFRTVLKNEIGEDGKSVYEKQVEFNDLREWLSIQAAANGETVNSPVQYDEFRKNFYFELRQNLSMHPDYKQVVLKLSAYEVWREIRGLIKGFAGESWQPGIQAGEAGCLSLQYYLSLGENYTAYSQEEKKVIYEIAMKYMQWLKKTGKADENDLCRQLLRNQEAVQRPVTCYDWIVIDEVQDLTELELYLLHTLVKLPGHFLLSGDYHQTIAPTYFDTRRVMSLLECRELRYGEDANRMVLTHNYRNPQRIVELANHLSDLRKLLFGKDKRNDYSHETAVKQNQGTLLSLCRNPEEKMKLLQEAVEKAYVYIVVATEEEKKALEKQLNNQVRIFTIYEVKGLENRLIIGVNLLSHFKDEWDIIRKHQEDGKFIKESQLYRYLINMLYVTLTRTEETLCLIEDECESSFITELLGSKWEHQKSFHAASFGLGEHSSVEDFYKEGLKFERVEDYERAMKQYAQIKLPQAKLRMKFCEAKLKEAEGLFLVAAQLYEEAHAKAEAAACYKKAKAYDRYYACLIEVDEEQFKREVLMNPAVDYERDLKPHLGSKLKKRIEALCLKEYELKLQEDRDELEYSLLYMEELEEQMKKVQNRLKLNKIGEVNE